MADVEIFCIRREDHDLAWPDLEPMFKRSVERVPTGRTVEQIRQEAADGRLALWVIRDADGVLGALSTGWRDDITHQTVIFSDLGGRDMHRWMDLMFDTVESTARQHGASRSEFTGRPGWARVTKRLGYAPARITMQKVLQNGW